MTSLLALIVLVSSPYPFELDNGFLLEPLVGTAIQDREDDTALLTGIRVSYIAADITDAFIVPEAEFVVHSVFENAGDKPLYRWVGKTSISVYEIFNPLAVRVALGFGVEKRHSEWSPLFNYRAGLGLFFTHSTSLFVDLGGLYILRQARHSKPYTGTLGGQIVF